MEEEYIIYNQAMYNFL